MLDEQKWLAPFDGDNPSGESLRNENRFAELTRLATPVFQEELDDNKKPIARKPIDRRTEPVEWDAVLEMAQDLSEVGRDIRLLTILARAMVGQEGLSGAIGGLDLITSALDQFWESVHPQVRDGANATRRLNAIRALEDDEAGLYGDLMRLEIMNERGIGSVTLAEAAQASLNSGQIVANAADGLSAAEKAALTERHEGIVQKVETACRSMSDQNPEGFAALEGLIKGVSASVLSLEEIVAAKLDAPTLRLPLLKTALEQALKTFKSVAAPASAPASGGTEEKPQTVTDVTEQKPQKAAIESNAEGGSAIPNQLNSRDDVQRCLQLIIDFYAKTEPSSPIPLLATRMKKMVPMDFMELMQELAPSGLKEFNNVAGNSDKK